MEGSLDSKINRVLDSEVHKIVEEIVYIDKRLSELGDGEEDEAERVLLTILRRHLINDLMEIAGFIDEHEMEDGITRNKITSTGISIEDGGLKTGV